jgi:hypothetical protein
VEKALKLYFSKSDRDVRCGIQGTLQDNIRLSYAKLTHVILGISVSLTARFRQTVREHVSHHARLIVGRLGQASMHRDTFSYCVAKFLPIIEIMLSRRLRMSS